MGFFLTVVLEGLEAKYNISLDRGLLIVMCFCDKLIKSYFSLFDYIEEMPVLF